MGTGYFGVRANSTESDLRTVEMAYDDVYRLILETGCVRDA